MNEETLFQEALSRSPEERAAFLDQACEGRPELRAAVEALLAAHEKSANVLDRPPAQTVDSGTGQPHPDPAFDHTPGPGSAPSSITETTEFVTKSASGNIIAGRFTLQEKIGEGGMGEVWSARQTEPIKRKVALKLIKTGMDSRAVLQRFEQERQALAMMDHPNIARVLDGGLTPTGQPFFVMELVNGLPLTKFCDEARLTPRERLELFVPICQAVQHAHQKGIVHRDLKPANILVTMIDGKPVPKVIDFGVAKAIAGRLIDESMSTQFGAVIGTFEYMSPEQAGFSGVDIDTRADIYSLGVILYELLTGLRPFDGKRLRNAALTEMIRIIQEEEPSKPSTRLSTDESLPSMAALRQTEPRKLMALLRGELDWVVMKCLEKHRERRYESANALARDIQRYLADEAVEARPPSARYRFGKFLHRHRGPVLAASLVLLALVGGIIGTTFGMIQAEHRRIEADAARGREAKRAEGERLAREQEAIQRAKAEKARDRTRQALDAMTSSVTGDSLTTQHEISDEQKKFLTEVLTYYQEFAGEKADDEPSRARTAAAAHRVGLIEDRLGRTTEAVKAYRTAVDGYTTLANLFPAVPEYRKALAGSHINLGTLLADLGERPEAEDQNRKALAILEKLAAEFPAVPDYRVYLANNHNNLGILLRDLGKRLEAEEQYHKALAIREKLAADYPAVPEYRKSLASNGSNLGVLLAELGKRPEAEEQFRKAQAIEEKLVAEFPAVPEHRESMGNNHNNLGLLLKDLGKWSEADEHYRKALAIRQKLVAEFPAAPKHRNALGGSHINLGSLLAGMGKWPEADEQYRKALAIREKLVADFPDVPEYRNLLAGSYDYLGHLLARMGKRPEAEQQSRKALAIREKLVTDFPSVPAHREELASSHSRLGVLLAELGRRPEAEEQFRAALGIREKLAALSPPVPDYRKNLAQSHNNLGLLLAGLGKQPEAEEQYRKAMAIQENLAALFPAVPEHRNDLAKSHNNLGTMLADLGRRREAEEQIRSILALLEKLVADFPAVPEHRRDLAVSHNSLGLLLADLGKRPEAEEQYRKALEVQEKLAALFPAVPEYRVGLGGSYCNFGILVSNTGQPAQSLEWFEKAIRTLSAAYEQDRRFVRARQFLRNSHWNRAIAYDRLRQFTEAIKDWDKAVALSPMAEQSGFRAARASSRLRAGQVAEALAEVAELTKNPSGGAASWYVACFYAIASGKSDDKKQEYADRAMDLLQKAVKAGYNDPAHIAKDTDLDAIRGREDFKKLIEGLAKNSPSKPEPKP